MEIVDDGAGGYRLTISTPYKFGDLVWFDSDANGKGSGTILDIIVQQDGQVYFAVLLDDGTVQSGIHTSDIKWHHQT